MAGHKVFQLNVVLGNGGLPKVLRNFGRACVGPEREAVFEAMLLRREVGVWDMAARDWRRVEEMEGFCRRLVEEVYVEGEGRVKMRSRAESPIGVW